MAEVDQSRVYDAGVGKQDQHLQDSTADSNYKVDYVVDAPPRFGGEDTSGDNFGYSDYYEVGQQAYSSGHQRMQGGPGARQGGPGAAAVAGELPPGRLTGRCKWFNGPKGFGFILPDNGSGEVLLLRQLTPIGGGGGISPLLFLLFFFITRHRMCEWLSVFHLPLGSRMSSGVYLDGAYVLDSLFLCTYVNIHIYIRWAGICAPVPNLLQRVPLPRQ